MRAIRSLLVVVAAAATLIPAGTASAAPTRADLVVDTTTTPAEVLDTGGSVMIHSDVRNAGGKGARDVTVTRALPVGAWVFSDGWVPAAGWQCAVTTTASCRYGTLAAGASAPRLSVPIGLAPSPVGTVVLVGSVVTTPTMEESTVNNTDQSPVTTIESVADVAIEAFPSATEVRVGDPLDVNVTVHNAGTAMASDVVVVIPLASHLAYGSEWADTDWTCAFLAASSAWRCTHGPLAPGQYATTFALSATVATGSPGDSIVVSASASTSSPDADESNNTWQTVVAVVA